MGASREGIGVLKLNKGVIVLKRATVYTVSALMVCASTLTGCGTVSANIGSRPMKTGGYSPYASTSQGAIISHIYTVEGKIAQVNQSSNVIDSIQLDVIKPIASVDSEYEPLKPGREYTIYFDEPKSKLHSLQLTKGTVIDIEFGQFVRYSASKQGWIWGSNFDWMKVSGVSTSPKSIIEKSYPSSTEATDVITNLEQNYGQFYPTGPAVNLGLGIKAEFSGGAGQYGFKWNEGRWIVLTRFWGNGAAGTKLVKKIVAYLHTHMLPVPESKGVIIIQQTGSSTLKVTKNTIAWQVGNKVYQLQQTDDAIQALQIVVNSNRG